MIAAMENDTQPKPTRYDDGECPVFSRAVATYRRQRGGDGLCWVDVTRREVADLGSGLTRAAALACPHLRPPHDGLLDGAAAFAALWSALPRRSWLGQLWFGYGFADAGGGLPGPTDSLASLARTGLQAMAVVCARALARAGMRGSATGREYFNCISASGRGGVQPMRCQRVMKPFRQAQFTARIPARCGVPGSSADFRILGLNYCDVCSVPSLRGSAGCWGSLYSTASVAR